MSVLIDLAGLSTALDLVTLSAIFFKLPEGDIISPNLSDYTRAVLLSDRNGDEIVPVGAAAATYTADGVSVEEAVNDLYAHLEANKVRVVNQTESEVTIQPNVMNVWGTVTNLKVIKGTDIDGIVNNYMIRFTAGDSAAVIFNGMNVKWYGGEVPTWTAGNAYEISIVDNIALWVEIEA